MNDKNYYEIFEELIGKNLKNTIIYKYDSTEKIHRYTPFRHDCKVDAEKVMGELMRKYIYMYAYSEPEVIKAYNKGRLADLEIAADRALRERLPNRKGARNGIYSELLLDLLITMYSKGVNKLATRAIYRQRTDNQEIKGFDSLHIITYNGMNQLWLGQAKMGREKYCIDGIIDDLNNKMNMLYTAEQLYFIADKEQHATEAAINLLEEINDISYECDSKGLSEKERVKLLEELFVKRKIRLILPCLLAYGSEETYNNISVIDTKIKQELEKMIAQFDDKFKSLINISYKVLIMFIPIRDLNILRESMRVEL